MRKIIRTLNYIFALLKLGYRLGNYRIEVEIIDDYTYRYYFYDPRFGKNMLGKTFLVSSYELKTISDFYKFFREKFIAGEETGILTHITYGNI